jgi:hypothetical protein
LDEAVRLSALGGSYGPLNRSFFQIAPTHFKFKAGQRIKNLNVEEQLRKQKIADNEKKCVKKSYEKKE